MSSEEYKIWTFVALGLMVLFIFLVGEMILRRRKQRIIESEATPYTEQGLTQYDDYPPGIAVVMAWSEAGDFPRWHRQKQDELRKNMPVLARALDRLVEN